MSDATVPHPHQNLFLPWQDIWPASAQTICSSTLPSYSERNPHLLLHDVFPFHPSSNSVCKMTHRRPSRHCDKHFRTLKLLNLYFSSFRLLSTLYYRRRNQNRQASPKVLQFSVVKQDLNSCCLTSGFINVPLCDRQCLTQSYLQ